jgi:hypothetical protein
MKPSLFCLCFLFCSLRAAEYALPAGNQSPRVPGVDVGVVGGIFQYMPGGSSARTSIIDVSLAPYNADKTGATSAKAAIQSAIDAATANSVVYLPTGTYLVDGIIFIPNSKDDITIRGDGTGTVIHGKITDNAIFSVGGSWPSTPQNLQVVTGAKAKGMTTLAIPNTAGYTLGSLVQVVFDNEEDEARIQAGAAPTWSTGGYRGVRTFMALITGVSPNASITIEPGLPWDGANHGVTVSHGSTSGFVEKVGFENLSFTFDTTNKPTKAIDFNRSIECWVYNVTAPNWNRTSSNGQVVNINRSFRTEIRKCKGVCAAGASSDGFVQVTHTSNHLIEDNIFDGYDVGIYDWISVHNGVYSYNLHVAGGSVLDKLWIQHQAHPSLMLVEGNIGQATQSDGYYGSASNNTMHRNWIYGFAALKRFVRMHAFIGNVFGRDGVKSSQLVYGQPNVGNGFSTGTAQFTSNNLPADWKITGTLTVRTSDSIGVVTASSGNWAASTGGSSRDIILWWDGFAKRRNYPGTPGTSISGNVITVTGGSGDALPQAETIFDLIGTGPQGTQELDLDVQLSTILVHNYEASAVGTGSVTNSTASALPASLAYTSKPSWWPASLAWPPINPDSPAFSYEIIPAGYRYVNGVDAPDSPLATATIATLNVTTLNIAP